MERNFKISSRPRVNEGLVTVTDRGVVTDERSISATANSDYSFETPFDTSVASARNELDYFPIWRETNYHPQENEMDPNVAFVSQMFDNVYFD